MHQLIDRLQLNISSSCDLTAEEEEKLKYSLEVIFSELSKTILLMLLFALINKHIMLLYCLLSLASIRPFTGGLHFNTYWSCLTFTGLFAGIVVLLSTYTPDNKIMYTLLYIISASAVMFIGPVTSKKRPQYSRLKRRKFKLTAFAVITAYLIVYYITSNKFSIVAIWTAVLQAVQLLMSKGVSKFEKTKCN